MSPREHVRQRMEGFTARQRAREERRRAEVKRYGSAIPKAEKWQRRKAA